MDLIDSILRLHMDKIQDLHQRLIRALEQLNDEDVNWRPNDESNSIANLVLHMAGNLRQRYVAGIGGQADTRDRDEEFNNRDLFSQSHLLDVVNDVFDGVARVMSSGGAEILTKEYWIQDEKVTGLDTIFGTATHMSEHVGQILYIAKLRRGKDYEVIWMPHHRE